MSPNLISFRCLMSGNVYFTEIVWAQIEKRPIIVNQADVRHINLRLAYIWRCRSSSSVVIIHDAIARYCILDRNREDNRLTTAKRDSYKSYTLERFVYLTSPLSTSGGA